MFFYIAQFLRGLHKIIKNGIILIPFLPMMVISMNVLANSTSQIRSHSPSNQALVDLAKKTVKSLRYTSYKLGGGYFNLSKGIYILDCSNYVDRLLKQINPRAYSRLLKVSQSDTPTSFHYYHLFSRLPANHPKKYWNKVKKVKQLQPGDILVFRIGHSLKKITNGHVMVVMNKPIKKFNSYLVRVADAAPFRHSQDTRLPHTSGIGIGTLLLKADPVTGKPLAYAWRLDSLWRRNVFFAMARPVGLKITR